MVGVTTITAVVAAVFGAITTYLLAARRERRRKLEEVVDRLAPWLQFELRAPSAYREVPRADLIVLRRLLGRSKRAVFDRHFVAYETAKQEDKQRQDATGQVFFKDPTKIQEAVAKILKCLHRS